jgi:cytochrome P450 family 135
MSRQPAAPPGSRLPGWAQTALFVADPVRFLAAQRRRYGPIFRVRFFGFPSQAFVTTAALAE